MRALCNTSLNLWRQFLQSLYAMFQSLPDFLIIRQSKLFHHWIQTSPLFPFISYHMIQIIANIIQITVYSFQIFLLHLCRTNSIPIISIGNLYFHQLFFILGQGFFCFRKHIQTRRQITLLTYFLHPQPNCIQTFSFFFYNTFLDLYFTLYFFQNIRFLF